MTLARWTRMLRLTLVLLLGGCVGDLVELTPGLKTTNGVDMAQAPAAGDLAQAPTGDDGGTTAPGDLAQPTVHFDPTIQTDIDTLGCSAASCHGGTQVPLLVRMPVAATDKQNNYDHFKAEAMMGEMSNILVKNLVGSGVSHTGGSAFPSKSDPTYQRWLLWIEQGNPQ